ncbi:MAG TPA: sigma-70 family RNA polymerase sigma factor [Thermoanaerobaculia bacterium]
MESVLDAPPSLGQGRGMSATGAPGQEPAGLVLAVRRGEEGAFERLYARWAPVVQGLLLARAPRSAVDDLIQEVFLTVYRKLPSLRDPGAFPGWICTIARTRAADYHRREPATEELPETLEDAREPTEETVAVFAALSSLPEAYRETLTLRLVEGLTGPEIAAATGLTPGSVRVNLHRGMQLLRAALTAAAKDRRHG